MSDELRASDMITRALLAHAASAPAQPTFLPPVRLWRLLAVGALGGAVAVLVAFVAPVTRIEGAALAAVLTLGGMTLGGFLDLRALSRRLRREEEHRGSGDQGSLRL